MTGIVAPPLRDYLLGTTHRKDALDGGLWQKLRRQLAGVAGEDETGGTRPAAPLHDGRAIVLPATGRRREGIDAAADLGSILQDAAGVVRWEPINPNAEHRVCPSPGNRFTVDVEIGVGHAGDGRWFRYLPHDRMLAEIAAADEVGRLGQEELGIVLRGHVDRCAQPYGDLALCLATIEIGAMLAQLVLALGRAGLAADDVRFVGDGGALDPVLHLRVGAPDLADWLARAPAVPVRLARPLRSRPEDTGGRLLHDLRTFVSNHAREWELFPRGLAVSGCETLVGAAAVRSSGLDLQAGADGTPAPIQLTTLLGIIRHLHAAFGGLDMLPVRVDVRLGEPLVGAEEADLAGDVPAWLHIGSAPGRPTSPGYAHPRGAVVMTVSADLRDYAARTGAIALSAMHLAAGITTQIVCLAAAHAGLACRPMRSFDHAAADAALPIDFWSLIQLVVYADRAPNPAFVPAGTSRAERR